ncbi:MAG: ribulokinase [Candidatus Omnitrophica bacterium]|nr:ribulokinase [Candidatus Omnitrophota bacterium]
MAYSLGLDFGTNSVRALLVNLKTGEETAESIVPYPSGTDGIILDAKDPHLARQNPADYLICLEKVVKNVLRDAAKKEANFSPEIVVGIGVDTTGSTPLSVDAELIPLSFHPEFSGNIHAYAWLWKDHTSTEEAEEITHLARKIRPHYLQRIGGVYSSEWFFSKILHLSRVAPEVFQAASSFIELADYIPAVLAGRRTPKEAVRCICAAGHKALYSEDWGGLPDDEFLITLSPDFRGLRQKLYEKAYPAGKVAGFLSRQWAIKLGLAENTPISVGAFDAHMGAVGSGIKEEVLVKILGTSTCDMMIFPRNQELPAIPGLCGMVPDSIVPGYWGLEAGQSAVGDIFYWFVKTFMPEFPDRSYRYFEKEAEKLRPGESGLLALDWHNGNRTILVDQKLTGLIVGFTLKTKPYEVYRALIEATAFGARVIIERLEKYRIKVSEIITGGGIAEKSPFLMQLYADIIGRPFRIPASSQSCALGAAIFGALAADPKKTGETSLYQLQEKLCRFKPEIYQPRIENHQVYNRLYSLYRRLHDAFGTKAYNESLYSVMKELLDLKWSSSGQ